MKTILSLLLLGALSASAQFQLISRVQLVPLSNWVGVISTNFTAISNNFVTVSNGVNSRQWGSLNLTNWGLFDTSVIASVAQQTLINSNLNWIGRTNGVGQKPTFYHQISLTNDAGDGGNTVFAIRHTDPSASFAQSWYYASGTKQWQIAADTNVFQFNHGGGSDPMVGFFQNGNTSIGRAGGSVTNIGIWRGQSNVFMSLIGTSSAPVSLLGRLSTSEIVETAFAAPPIGSITAWAKSLTGVPSLPSGWVECNGQSLSDTGSPLNGQTIPNLNASGGGTQRFLRGATASGGTGGADTHVHTLGNISTGSITVDNGAAVQVVAATAASESTDNGSSLPSYYEVVWIMRVK